MDFPFASITIQQIIVFLRVVENGGFAKASNHLNMTQSAVSKSIARMEKDLDILLFQRTTREIHLTEAGRVLYDNWKQTIKDINNSYIQAVAIQTTQNNTLHIGILNTARPELYFWNIQEQFTKAHPDIQIELGTAYMTDLELDLFRGKYDLIMIPDFERFSLAEMDLCWKWAASGNMQVIMSTKHPLAQHTSLKTTDILQESFAALNQGDISNHKLDLEERFARYHVTPTFGTSYKNAYEIRLLFRNQINMLLIADDYFEYPQDPNLVKIPLIDQKNGIICAWNPNHVTPQIQTFLDALSSIQKQNP